MVRSALPCSAAMRDGIRTVFHDATGATATKGTITFQSAPPDFVELPATAPSGLPGLLV